MRRGVAAVVAALALCGLAAGRAQASPGARFGIQDDAWLLYGPGSVAQRLTALQRLGAGLVRVTLRWDEVAPTRPAQPGDGTDPAYRWGAYDDVLEGLHARGIEALVTLYGSPRWANGGGPPSRLPSAGLADFARAAALRYPWVRLWTVWNEPNNGVFASPVSPSLYVRRLLNPVYAALHAVSPRSLVAAGPVSPRRTPSGMSPLAFLDGLRAAHAHLDAFALNPYPLSTRETPFRASCSRCGYFTMATLPAVRADVARAFGRKPLWLTEYGYQTNPPDRVLGVSPARQAAYLGEAALRVWRQPGVTVLVQFLLRDEPGVGGWQSGLYTAAGAPKPAARAFPLPLAVESRTGSHVRLWGQVRPGSGPRTYVLQLSTGRGWRAVARGVTASSGVFVRTIAVPRGASVRLSSPGLGYASPGLPV